MPKSATKAHSKIVRKSSLWKKMTPIPTAALLVISIILLTQTLYCYSDPQNYPVKASELTRTRYDTTINPPSQREVYSIPTFLQCSVNSKTNYVITLTSLEEVGVKSTIVSYLTDNSTSLDFQQTYLLSIGKINDLTVTLNGQTLTPFLTDVNGIQCYAVKGFNLTNTSQVETFVISFSIERTLANNQFIKIPWIFNDNYAQYTAFPSFNVPIGENVTSEVSTFEVYFELPFRQLVTSASGWMDLFDMPRSHWIFVNSSAWYEPTVEYPINQTIETSGNTYYFKTIFSKENVANKCVVSVIPSFCTTLLLLIFIASPLYICVIEYTMTRYEKRNQKTPVQKAEKGYLHLAYLALKTYGIPIIAFIGYLLTDIGQAFSLLSYLLSIMNPYLAPFIFGYPIISYIALHKTILKT